MLHHYSFCRLTAYRLTAAGLVCLVLASCATVKQQQVVEKEQPAVSEPVGWSVEQQKRQQIKSWEIRGRLGLQTEDNGGTMDLIWKQSVDEFSIRLMAPLGSGNYLIQGDKDFAEIRYPDGYKQIVDNVDDIFVLILEVNLPATAIKDWIRGLPAGELSVEQTSWNDQGLLNRIKQSGWNVEMTKYTGSKILLPHAIYLSRDDDPELDIRLLLSQWLVDN